MNILVFKSDFSTSLYQWALRKASEEVVADFPLMRKVKSRAALTFLEAIQCYSEEERLCIVDACVKLRHQKTLMAEHENISSELRLIAEKFREDSRKLFDLRYRKMKAPRISKALLSTLVLEQLNPIFGDLEQVGFFTWKYRTSLNTWILETTITCEGEFQLSYRHRIIHAADATFTLLERTNVLDCLGLVTSEWDLLSYSELETASNNFKTLCNEFLEALQSLIHNLPDISFNNPATQFLGKQNLVSLGRNLDLRLYQWAKLDYQREVASNFEFLNQIRGSTALRNLAIFRSLSQTETLNLLNTLVKRTISYDSFTNSGDSWSDEDQERWEDYNQRLYNTPNLSEIESEILILASFEQINLKIQKRNLKILLKRSLQDIVGNVVKNRGLEIIFKLPLGGYSLYTEIDLGGYSQIRYRHWFSLDGDNSRCIGSHRNISLMGWMGLGETAWNLLTEEDVPIAVNALQQFCAHFVSAIATILDDL